VANAPQSSVQYCFVEADGRLPSEAGYCDLQLSNARTHAPGLMNSFTAYLCTKPAIGIALYFMSLCANNQALRDVTVDLRQAGPVVTREVRAPMDEDYRFMLWRGAKATDGAEDATIAFVCKHSSVISLTLTLTHEGESAGDAKTFVASCPFGESGDPSTLQLGQVRMKKGVSRLAIVNNSPLALPAAGRVGVLLVGNGVSK
jgi:hypothetical protein